MLITNFNIFLFPMVRDLVVCNILSRFNLSKDYISIAYCGSIFTQIWKFRPSIRCIDIYPTMTWFLCCSSAYKNCNFHREKCPQLDGRLSKWHQLMMSNLVWKIVGKFRILSNLMVVPRILNWNTNVFVFLILPCMSLSRNYTVLAGPIWKGTRRYR